LLPPAGSAILAGMDEEADYADGPPRGAMNPLQGVLAVVLLLALCGGGLGVLVAVLMLIWASAFADS
jgi:hypothetical protein